MRKQIRRTLVVLLVFVIVALMIPITTMTVSATSNMTLRQLQAKFPAGKYWNHAGSSTNNPDGYTDTPCYHHGSCDYYGRCGCNSAGNAIQCFGFANKLAYDAYGSYYTSWSRTTLSNLKAGDVIRYKNDGHSIFVTGLDGDTITYGDCNSDGHCIIRWGATISKSTIAATLTGVYSAPSELTIGDEPDNSHNPVGSLDLLNASYGVVNIGGWAFDNDDVNAQLEINVYIGGVAGDPNAEPHGNIWANGYRPDVNNVYGCGDYHGFTASISTSKTGVQDIYVYALNVGSGWHSILGCVTVDIPPVNNPVTNLDLVEGKQSAVFIQGWAFDEDDINSTIDIRVIIGDQNTEEHLITANTERKDVNKVYSCGDNHGFKSTIFTSKKGTQHIQIYAINIGSGKDVFVGEQTVNIAEDSERPTIEQYYTSHVEHNQYKVCVIPKDNIGINIVRIATWTQDDQSDLIWNDAVDNGVGTFYVDIKRSDFSQTENSLYHNHIYVYDYAGNVRFQSIDMDYKITSNTGENVPEGDYRIITAVNENKALDVFSESMDDDANIQIFSNLNNQNQIFSLSYIDNGFYKISNIKSNKPIDVYGDNYVSGTNVVLSHYHGGANQQWMLQPAGDGYYYIIARSNGLALDVYYAIDEDGTNVQVHTPNQSAAQKWKLRRVLKQDMVKVVSWKLVNGIMKPNVKVIVDGKFLVENTDYTVSSYIENNTLCAKITGIDNYCDSVSIEYQEPKYQIADTNLDGNINVLDVTAIQRHLADLETFTEEQLAIADTNGDGNVDIADATHLQMYLAEYGVVLGKQ